MPLRTLRLLTATAVVGLAVAGATGGAVNAAQRSKCGGNVTSAGTGWLALHPHFSTGSSKVSIAKALPFAPSTIYATNGASVMRTGDGGCTWRTVQTPTDSGQAILPIALPQPLDGLLRVPSTFGVDALAAPSSATAPSAYLYIGGTNSSPVLDQPLIYVVNMVTGQLQASSGLPRAGVVESVTAVDSVPTTAYAVISGGGALGDPGLWFTTDAGANWKKAAADVSALERLRANPVVQTSLFALSGRGVVTNGDGGNSGFSPPTHPSSDVTSYDVATGGGYVRIVEGHAGSKTYDRSDDGGLTWSTQRSPVVARQIAMQPIIDQVAISDGHRVFLEDSGVVTRAKDITPQLGVPDQIQLTAPIAAGYGVVGVVRGVIVRAVYNLKRSIVPPGPGLTPVVLLPHPPPHRFPATLLPGSAAVTLAPGHHEDVQYRLLLPRTPSPVDVMFLIDTTSSTEHTINGLRQDLAGIVNDLADAGLDAQFGIGDFRDYAPEVRDMGAGERGDWPYKLRRAIGPDDSSLRAAINKLRAGGGGDPAESDLTALYQSTTGAGQTWKHGTKVVVASGQDAHYRSNSLRLAVLATDQTFHSEASYLTPSWTETVAALRAHQIHPIGLAVQTVDERGNPAGFRSLRHERELAVDTGTLAPTGGVDCDGDLSPDVAAGGPFVCKVPLSTTSTANVGGIAVQPKTDPVKLAPAIVTAAESLPDMRTVSLGLSGAGGIASVVAPSPQPRVNLKNDNTLDYTVRFTCPKSHTRHVYRLGVDANDGSRVLATADATVVCDALALPPKPKLPPAAAVIPPAAAAAAPPAPGNPVPNANPNPNPVPNANVGFAGQEEEQKQLAFADADQGPEETTELAMSRPSPDADYQLWFAGATMLLTGAAGYAARTRLSAAWHQA